MFSRKTKVFWILGLLLLSLSFYASAGHVKANLEREVTFTFDSTKPTGKLLVESVPQAGQEEGQYKFTNNHYNSRNRVVHIKNLTNEQVNFELKIDVLPETKQDTFFMKFMWEQNHYYQNNNQQNNSYQNNYYQGSYIGEMNGYNGTQRTLRITYRLQGNEEVFLVIPIANKEGNGYGTSFSHLNALYTVTADQVYTVSQHYQLGY